MKSLFLGAFALGTFALGAFIVGAFLFGMVMKGSRDNGDVIQCTCITEVDAVVCAVIGEFEIGTTRFISNME